MSKSTCSNNKIDIPKECDINALNNIDKIQRLNLKEIKDKYEIGEVVFSLILTYEDKQLEEILGMFKRQQIELEKQYKENQDFLKGIIERLNKYINEED